MGDKDREPFQLSFNGFVKVDFQGSRVTSDGGLLLVRELDERLGLGRLIDEHLSDTRQGENKKFPLADLLRQSVYSRLAGYEDLNDAVRVSAERRLRGVFAPTGPGSTPAPQVEGRSRLNTAPKIVEVQPCIDYSDPGHWANTETSA